MYSLANALRVGLIDTSYLSTFGDNREKKRCHKKKLSVPPVAIAASSKANCHHNFQYHGLLLNEEPYYTVLLLVMNQDSVSGL